MTTFAELNTKKARVEFIKEKLKTGDRWLLKGLLTIYANQTADEQRQFTTKEDNGIGFSGCDAEILSSFAQRILDRGVRPLLEQKTPIDASSFFTPKQLAILRNKMPKYARQLAEIASQNCPIVKTPKAQ